MKWKFLCRRHSIKNNFFCKQWKGISFCPPALRAVRRKFIPSRLLGSSPIPRQSADAPLTEHHKICGGYAALEWQKRSWRQSKIAIPPAFSDLTMLFLFLFLRFFFDTEQGIHVRLDRLQFLIFFPQPFVIFIGGFFLCQQFRVLRLQNFDRGQLLHALSVKGSLCRFMKKQICFVGSTESRFVCRLRSAVGSIGIPCFIAP